MIDSLVSATRVMRVRLGLWPVWHSVQRNAPITWFQHRNGFRPAYREQVLPVSFPGPASKRGGITVDVKICDDVRCIIGRRSVSLQRDARPRARWAVATMMKGEDRFLNEWIECCYHYSLLGADHFCIDDNRSLQCTQIRQLLQRHTDERVVTLLDWD